MTKIPNGYYIKARIIQDSEIANSPPHFREIWDWLIKEAQFRDMKVSGRMILRGQCFTTYREILQGLSWKVGYRKESYTKGQCESAMKFLRSRGMITTMKTTRGMIITVCNYDKYQCTKNYENQTETYNETRSSTQQHDTIDKNDKNVNNIKTISPEVKTSEPPVLQIPLISKNGDNPKFYPIYQNEIDEWKTDFPAVDILQTLKTIKQWNISNPKNRKTEAGIRRHITGWLSKEQNKAPRVGGKDKYANL
jgi:hypothetical protein